MTEIYKIPQYDLPKPKPNVSAHNSAINRYNKGKKRSTNKVKKIQKKRIKHPAGSIWYAYLLELENGMYYVGIATNVQRRFERHSRGKGAKWTTIHKPVRILETRHLGRLKHGEAAKMEDRMFHEYFPKYGYCLRGGGKSRVIPNW
jgi:predicted GIY-YIG superfamily endonuclease